MTLLQRSLAGAFLILAAAVVRVLAVNRLPKNTFLLLWGIALTRLLIPYSLPSAFSVFSLSGRLIAPQMALSSTAAESVWPVPSATESVTVAKSAALPYRNHMDPLAVVWLIGALACAAFFTVTYIQCLRKFRESLPAENAFVARWRQACTLRRPVDIRQSDRITVPLTYGVLRPVILLPKRMDWEDTSALAYVLTHEYMHIRRFDTVTKLLLTAALCIHWFNPMVWVMYVLANRDIELACDEAVIRHFGEEAKTAYALALICMEERKSAFAPFSNGFSENAIEERIVAIMKTKKTSRTALLAATVVIVGVTTAFATTEQSAADTAQVVSTVSTVTSYTSPEDGQTRYSSDGGVTWKTAEEWNASLERLDVEWWTADEYAAWLENEKKELQSVIGSRSWSLSTGWYTWTQEKVDETIARYEQTLKDIQSGMKISKPIADGSIVVSMADISDSSIVVAEADVVEATDADAQSLLMTASEVSDENVAGDVVTEADAQNARLIANSEWFPAYEKYGLRYDKERSVLLYNGEVVNFFHDETAPGVYTHVTFNTGTIGLAVLRDAAWQVTGLEVRMRPVSGEAASEAAVSEVGLGQATAAENTTSSFQSSAAPSQAELLAEYGPFGISFDADRMLYKGTPVRFFVDGVKTENGVATRYVYQSDNGTLNLQTVRAVIDNGDGSYDLFGPLTGIIALNPEDGTIFSVVSGSAAGSETTEAAGNSGSGSVSFAERFAAYKDFGITYVESGASGAGNVYLNGQLVSHFSDVTPNGGAFSFTSADKGDMDVQTVYDKSGKLTGVEVVR